MNEENGLSVFRKKLIDMTSNSVNNYPPHETLPEHYPRGQKPLIEKIEKFYNIYTNGEGNIMFCIKIREGVENLPEIFYSGGKNALLRRRMDQFIFIDEIHPDVRGALREIDEVLFAEYSPLEDGSETDMRDRIQLEYDVPVRHLPRTVNLSSVYEILADGYPILAAFASFVRLSLANSGKLISDIITSEDYSALAAVLAGEEDYETLEKYINEGLPVNEKVGWWFNEKRPTPILYVISPKVWRGMRNPIKMLMFLVRHGADITGGNETGVTPLDIANKYASENELDELLALLNKN